MHKRRKATLTSSENYFGTVCGAPAVDPTEEERGVVSKGEQETVEFKEDEHVEAVFTLIKDNGNAQEDESIHWESDELGTPVDTAHTNVTISLDAAGSSRKAPRISYSKKDRERCQIIHRSHLLCLVARALLYDSAADSSLLQAVLLSIVPEDVSQEAHCTGLGDCSKGKIEKVLRWFRSHFKLTAQDQQETAMAATIKDDDEVSAALLLTNGVEGIISQLVKATEMKCGGAEELVTLLIALLRALGMDARSLRALHPSSLRPADVARQEEEAMRRYSKRSTGPRIIDLDDSHEGTDKKESRVQRFSKKTLTTGTQTDSPAENCEATSAGTGLALADIDQLTDRKRRRKGDEEFEQQLALAIAATDFEVGDLHKEEEKPAGVEKKMTTPIMSRAPKTRQVRGAAWGSTTGVGTFWLEVYTGSEDTGKWMHVDPLTGWVDSPEKVEGILLPCGQPLTYVIACSEGGALKDVTQRYTTSFLSAQKLRDSQWWEGTLKQFRPVMKKANPIAWAREDAELKQRAQRERRGLPTTIEGFKCHPRYVLQRHITKYQSLKPDSSTCGLHRGEAYYLREDIVELHTNDRWRRLGREVMPGELAFPAKMVKKRGAAKSSSDLHKGIDGDFAKEEEEEGEEEEVGETREVCLYGQWQTDELVLPSAVNGKVPKNERGNVEVPPFAHALPPGTVHLSYQNIAATCRNLKVDYAPALTGFDIRRGRSVPVLDGVVVCEEVQALVLETYLREQREKEERERRKQEAEAEAGWRLLLRLALARVRLGKSHTSGCDANTEAAATLVYENAGNEPKKKKRVPPENAIRQEQVDIDVEEI